MKRHTTTKCCHIKMKVGLCETKHYVNKHTHIFGESHNWLLKLISIKNDWQLKLTNLRKIGN